MRKNASRNTMNKNLHLGLVSGNAGGLAAPFYHRSKRQPGTGGRNQRVCPFWEDGGVTIKLGWKIAK